MGILSFSLLVYYELAMDTSAVEATLIALPMFLGVGQIGYSVINYRRTYKKEPQDVTRGFLHLSSRRLLLLLFITVGIMVTGFSFLIFSERYSIPATMGAIIAVICMLPLTFLIKRFIQGSSFQNNKARLNKKAILLGEITAFIALLVALIPYLGNFNIPAQYQSPFIVLALVAFEVLIILRIMSHSS